MPELESKEVLRLVLPVSDRRADGIDTTSARHESRRMRTHVVAEICRGKTPTHSYFMRWPSASLPRSGSR